MSKESLRSRTLNRTYIELKASDNPSRQYAVSKRKFKVVDFDTCRLKDKSQNYYEKMSKQILLMTDRIGVQMQQLTFNPA